MDAQQLRDAAMRSMNRKTTISNNNNNNSDNSNNDDNNLSNKKVIDLDAEREEGELTDDEENNNSYANKAKETKEKYIPPPPPPPPRVEINTQPQKQQRSNSISPTMNVFKERVPMPTPTDDFDSLLKEHTRNKKSDTPYLRMDRDDSPSPPCTPPRRNLGLSSSAPVLYNNNNNNSHFNRNKHNNNYSNVSPILVSKPSPQKTNYSRTPTPPPTPPPLPPPPPPQIHNVDSDSNSDVDMDVDPTPVQTTLHVQPNYLNQASYSKPHSPLPFQHTSPLNAPIYQEINNTRIPSQHLPISPLHTIAQRMNGNSSVARTHSDANQPLLNLGLGQSAVQSNLHMNMHPQQHLFHKQSPIQSQFQPQQPLRQQTVQVPLNPFQNFSNPHQAFSQSIMTNLGQYPTVQSSSQVLHQHQGSLQSQFPYQSNQPKPQNQIQPLSQPHYQSQLSQSPVSSPSQTLTQLQPQAPKVQLPIPLQSQPQTPIQTPSPAPYQAQVPAQVQTQLQVQPQIQTQFQPQSKAQLQHNKYTRPAIAPPNPSLVIYFNDDELNDEEQPQPTPPAIPIIPTITVPKATPKIADKKAKAKNKSESAYALSELETLKRLIAAKEAKKADKAKQKVVAKKTPKQTAKLTQPPSNAPPSTSNAPPSTSNAPPSTSSQPSQPPKQQSQLDDNLTQQNSTQPLQEEEEAITQPTLESNSLSPVPNETSNSRSSSPFMPEPSEVIGTELEELKHHISEQEAEIQAKQKDIANNEMVISTMQSELLSMESKCSTYKLRIQILREQLREHEAVLEEATNTQSNLREGLDKSAKEQVTKKNEMKQLTTDLESSRMRLCELEISRRISHDLLLVSTNLNGLSTPATTSTSTKSVVPKSTPTIPPITSATTPTTATATTLAVTPTPVITPTPTPTITPTPATTTSSSVTPTTVSTPPSNVSKTTSAPDIVHKPTTQLQKLADAFLSSVFEDSQKLQSSTPLIQPQSSSKAKERTPSPPKATRTNSTKPPQPSLQATSQTTAKPKAQQASTTPQVKAPTTVQSKKSTPVQTQASAPPTQSSAKAPDSHNNDLMVLRDLAMRSKQKNQSPGKQATQSNQPKPHQGQLAGDGVNNTTPQALSRVDASPIRSPVENPVAVDEGSDAVSVLDTSNLIFSSEAIYHTTYHRPAQDAFGAISQPSKNKKRAKRSPVSVAPNKMPRLTYEYTSPLLQFKSFRLSPHFRDIYGFKLGSPTFSNKINPFSSVLCRFELHGSCNDDKCQFLHERDYTLSPEDILNDLGSYVTPKPTELLELTKRSLKTLPFEEVATSLTTRVIAAKRRNEKLLPAHSIHLEPRKNKPASDAQVIKWGSVKKHSPKRSSRPASPTPMEDDESSILHGDFLPLYELTDAHKEPEKPSDQPETAAERYYDEMEDEVKPTSSAPSSPSPSPSGHEAGGATADANHFEHCPPHDISAWLNMVLLITKGETEGLPFETRHEALRHLAVALPLPDTNNRFSFALWKLYLIIYHAHARDEHDLGEIMSVCEDAVTCNPAQLYLWEMYISFASLVKDKLDLCDRALQGLGSTSLLTPDEKSYAVLYIVLLRVRTEFTSGHKTRGMEYLKTVLESNTDIYSSITAHHKSIGHLHYIHALAFGSLPSLYTLAKYAVNKEHVFLLPWKSLPSPSATVVESLRTAFELVTYNGHEQDQYVMVYLNYIHMEMSLGNKDDACFLCQHYLTSVPQSDRLLVAYALALEAMGNVGDAELSYQKWLQRKGSNKSFMVWNEYARLALRKAKPSSGEQAIAILTDSVRKHMLENNIRPPALDSSKSEFSQTRYMFHMLLRLDLPSSSSSLLSISEVSQVGNYSSDLYLWLNYAMFETLVRSDDAIVEDVFRNALLRLDNIEDRKRIWLEYISWSKNESSEEYIQQVVDEALNDISIDIKPPVSTHEPEYFIDNPAYVHLVTPYPFKDYEFHNEVIDQFLAYISPARRKLVLERSVAHFHSTNLPLSLRAAELEESLGNFNRAVAYLSSAIRNAPFNSDVEPCLIKLLDMSAKAGDSEEQRSSLEKAVQMLPISARIWKRFIDFEQASNNTEVSRIQQLVAEKDIEC